MDKLILKDLRANLARGIRVVRILNFDPRDNIGPVRVEIDASSACSYRCCFCGTHSYLNPVSIKPEIMSDETIHNLLGDLKKLRVKELLFSGTGEPLLCPSLVKAINQFGRYFKIEMLSNGSTLDLIDEELFRNLYYLTISLNSGNGASHQATHGYKGENQFPKITGNIERILKYRRGRDKVKLNYVVMADNINELDDFFKLAIKWNVSFMARPVDIGVTALAPQKLNEDMLREVKRKAQDYLEKVKLSGKLALSFQLMIRACDLELAKLVKNQPGKVTEQHLENSTLPAEEETIAVEGGPKTLYPCYMSIIQPYIDSNGNVLLCCSGGAKPLGNINRESFLTIWQKEENLLTRLLCTQMDKTKIPVIGACVGCTNVLYHSMVFHGIYSKIPILPGHLAKRAKS